MGETKSISIRCPCCGKEGRINVDGELVNKTKRGLVAINIAQDKICAHTFIVYIDRNHIVRDSFMADFHLILPEIDLEEMERDKSIPASNILDLDIIRCNIPAQTLTHVFRAYLMKKPILFVLEHEGAKTQFLKLFDFILKNSFKGDLKIESPRHYRKNRKSYKNHIVISKEDIIRDKEKILDPKKTCIESKIVEKFYKETDMKSSLIIIRNEFQKAFELSSSVHELVESFDNGKKITPKEIISFLEKEHDQKFNSLYFKFIVQIAQNYFGVNFMEGLGIGEASIWFWYLN